MKDYLLRLNASEKRAVRGAYLLLGLLLFCWGRGAQAAPIRLLPPPASAQEFPEESLDEEDTLAYEGALEGGDSLEKGNRGGSLQEFPVSVAEGQPQKKGLLYVQGHWRDVEQMIEKGTPEEKVLALECQLISEVFSPRVWREKVRDLDLPIIWAEQVLKTKGRPDTMAPPIYRGVLVSLLNQGGQEQRLSLLERFLTPQEEGKPLLRFLMRSVEGEIASLIPSAENIWFAPVAVRSLALFQDLRGMSAWDEILSAEEPAMSHSLQPYFWVMQQSLSCAGFDPWLRFWILEKGEEKAQKLGGGMRSLIQSLGKTLDGEGSLLGFSDVSLEDQVQFVSPLRLLASQGNISEIKAKIWEKFYRPGVDPLWPLVSEAVSSLRSVGLILQAKELAVNALISMGI